MGALLLDLLKVLGGLVIGVIIGFLILFFVIYLVWKKKLDLLF